MSSIRHDFLSEIFFEMNFVIGPTLSHKDMLEFIQKHEQLTPQEKMYMMNYIRNDMHLIRNTGKSLNTLCIYCQSKLSSEYSCVNCIREILKQNFKNWTSRNKVLDYCIQQFQLYSLNSKNARKLIEWVPLEKFLNLVHIKDGGFGSVYLANWSEGPIAKWDEYNRNFIRYGSTNVALKSMKTSNLNSEKFINEALSHMALTIDSRALVSCYGLTREPNTDNIMMILDYKSGGDLNRYLNNDIPLTWKERYRILYYISMSLGLIHDKGMVHRDLHPGNVLLEKSAWFVSDLGLCSFVNESELIIPEVEITLEPINESFNDFSIQKHNKEKIRKAIMQHMRIQLDSSGFAIPIHVEIGDSL
ncbi:16553_t:CDS:2 [Cetraspora pellucida]|uniref:16553_t:CDS:1 n=1 Tax=Cetraspora pellucida TaxID=1433469 RepID=A0A9N9JH92_9GLOM|nr:16553_t:CDS:2 [Cetraspora pellucida]